MRHTQLTMVTLLGIALTVTPPAIADDESAGTHATIKVEAVTDFVAQHEDTVILDVRTPMEYGLSHVPGAVNINIQDESFPELVSKLDANKTYIVYCTKNPVGGRSMTALAKLHELGFKDLYSMEGGHVAWSEAALPMSGTDDN